MKPTTALTIAGSDSGGGAGIQADLKTFAAFEVHGLCVITSLTAQNTQEVKGISNTPKEFVGKQIDTIMEDFDIKWAKTGMVSETGIIDTIIDKKLEYDINLVVDPVMKAASGSDLLEKNAINALKDLIAEAELVTPNIPEAEKLTGTKIKDIEDMQTAAEKIAALGPKNILIKGGHLEESKITNLLLHGNDFTEFQTERIDVSDIHGTGCVFSAAITSELAKKTKLQTAVKKASDFMVDAIKKRLKIGKGPETVNPMARIWKVAWDGKESEEVQKAAKKLVSKPKFEVLIPEVGTNIAMAPRNAQRREDVIGLTGRIIKVDGKPYLSGSPAAGGSKHIADIVMTLMKHDPEYRAAMNIRYSEKILDKCRDLGFEMSSFDRENEPADVETMKWGTEKALEKFEGIPDLIYDKGDVGKEAMIRLFGKKAAEVSEKAIQIIRELQK